MERWSAQIVTRAGDVIDELPRIRGGSLEWNAFAAVQSGGTLEFARAPSPRIDWITSRIRIMHHADGIDRPMGVYIPAWPKTRRTTALTQASVRLEDPTARLRSQLAHWAQYGAGTVVTDRIAGNLRKLGETAIALTPSGETLRTAMAWEPDKTWGNVTADLLDVIGYGSIWCDQSGWWRAAPYVPPAQRPIRAIYGGNPTDLLVRPEYEEEADLTDVPNHVLLWTRGDSEHPSLRAEARITDPAHPWHQDRVGLFSHAESVEATSQEVLDAKARRMLAEGLEFSRYVTWEHPVDGTTLGDRVVLRTPGADVVITHRKISLGIGAVVESRGRHIYTGGQTWQ